MKHLLFALLCLLSTVSFSQKVLPKLTYQETQDIKTFIDIKNNTSLLEYITANGNSIKPGDTLIIGKPTNAETSTFSQGNRRLKSRESKKFEYIQLGKSKGLSNMIASFDSEGPAMAGINFSGEKVLVNEISVYHQGSKKKPLNVIIILGEINGRAFGFNKYLTLQDAEGALELGEVLLKNPKMTRSEAIAKLKESQDLFELGMISKEAFEQLKEELTPIIMDNK